MIGAQKSPSVTNGFPDMTPLFSISHTTASSTRVPVPPLHDTKPSPKRISSKSRSCQVLAACSSSTQRFAWPRKNVEVIAIVRPPASLAPRDTASITPVYPPEHTWNPRFASSPPNRSASS